jgi:hypothetical protein
MAKKVEKKNTVRTAKKVKENTVSQTTVQDLTSGELLARLRDNGTERKRLSEKNKELIIQLRTNIAERRRLATENRELYRLYKAAKFQETSASAEARIQALTARLEKLRNSQLK